jgi:hypothetical protein
MIYFLLLCHLSWSPVFVQVFTLGKTADLKAILRHRVKLMRTGRKDVCLNGAYGVE